MQITKKKFWCQKLADNEAVSKKKQWEVGSAWNHKTQMNV